MKLLLLSAYLEVRNGKRGAEGGGGTTRMFLTAGILLVCAVLPLAECQYEYEEPLLYDTFPEDFMW